MIEWYILMGIAIIAQLLNVFLLAVVVQQQKIENYWGIYLQIAINVAFLEGVVFNIASMNIMHKVILSDNPWFQLFYNW